MNRTELDARFVTTLSYYVFGVTTDIISDPTAFGTYNYDEEGHMYLTSWALECAEPSINQLLAFTVQEVDSYNEKNILLPALVNQSSPVRIASSGDINPALLQSGVLVVVQGSLHVWENGVWRAL
jgi:hypothetical protein